jgi:hypothetical protein
MKLGYRDRIVILIAIIAIIVGLGIFVFIKPKWEKLNNNKETLETLNTEWDAKLLEFDRIPARQDNIKERYSQGNQIAQEFTDEMDSVQLENFLRDKFVNNDKFTEDKVKLTDTLSVSDISTSSVNYYYYVPNIVTYPLYEYADLDGSLAKDAAAKLLDSNILSARSSQTVGSGSATMKFVINREDTMELLNQINDYAAKNKDAMLIESVSLKEADFNENIEVEEDEEAGEPELDEDGNPIEAAPKAKEGTNNNNKNKVKKDYTEVTVIYRVYYMQEPTEPDVGPKYDKTIWDGDAWRTAVAE